MGTAALIDPTMPGTLIMYFRLWSDQISDGSIDMSEPVGDSIVYTITVIPNAIGGKIYVDSSAVGLNNGLTWANAYTDFQSALNTNICNVDSILVAKGTYYPAAAPPPTYNFYTDCSMGQNNAIITAGNGSISVQFLTNKIEYVKVWYSTQL
ncbi:MAG: hypothetical protein IPO25_07650 [Saprospiraceae bacterium]|nr:hypothetical protein [Saprospiraceae bacterium]